jgi:hypothetical protein
VVKSQQFDVTCVGWSSRLEHLGAWTNIAAMTAYNFITTIMLADARLLLASGDIRNDGWTAPAVEVRPYKRYREILDEYMKQLERWFWTVDENGFNWRQYGVGEADYIVLLEECETGDMADANPAYANALAYAWGLDGSQVKVGQLYDADAITAAGMTIMDYVAVPGKCTDSQALAFAQTRLSEMKVSRMQAGFTTSAVYDAKTYTPIDLKRTRVGSNVMVLDLLTFEEAISAARQVDSLSTFMIKNVRYENAGPRVVITPGDFQARTDVWMARAEAKSK